MQEVMSFSMLCESDVAALRSYLRRQYRTSHDTCCVSLLSMSYIGFERQCRASIRETASDGAFGAHVCAGMKLEYHAQRVVVKRSMTLMSAAPGETLGETLGARTPDAGCKRPRSHEAAGSASQCEP